MTALSCGEPIAAPLQISETAPVCLPSAGAVSAFLKKGTPMSVRTVGKHRREDHAPEDFAPFMVGAIRHEMDAEDGSRDD